jgi:hypothetical protein
VSRSYTLAQANALIPELVVLTERLRLLRDEVVGLRDAYRDRETVLLEELVDASESGDPGIGEWQDTAGGAAGHGDPDLGAEPLDPELRRLRLRMRGLVDQMQADAAWLDDRDIVLRDIGSGLLDFPGEADGREIWLCWRLGEASVGFWHRRDEGFGSRRPIAEANLSAPA